MGKPAKKRKRRWVWYAAVLSAALMVGGWSAFKIWQTVSVADDAPVIGTSLDTAWHARMGISTKNYEIALTSAGARIDEFRPADETAEDILDRIDGLLLTGGGDIDPELYGQDDESAQLVDRKRDAFEQKLIRGAIERDMPILGICRGIQILNVAYGGTLRNLRENPQLADTHGIGIDSLSAHSVEIVAESRLADILGSGTLHVNSFHGQAVDKIGDGLKVVATAPDGVVEALELPGKPFVLALQWHPEIVPMQMPVWNAFLKAAKQYRKQHGR